MVSTSSQNVSIGQRVFVSYSRTDRQRVIGITELLEALGHEVFMDERSILSGERWKTRLMDALRGSDVLVVFWTRHAARSKWVTDEYETFAREHPERLLVPIVGDSTPLTAILEERQSTDFCPLLNELLAMKRDMEARRLSKSAIRKAVVERLAQDGIRLPNSKLNRIFGMCGILGLVTLPLHLLQKTRDFTADRLAGFSRGYVYAAASASTLSLVVCGSATHEDLEYLRAENATIKSELSGLQRIGQYVEELWVENEDLRKQLANTPEITKVDIGPYSTGTRACDAKGLICVSVDRTRIVDKEKRFFGHSTPTCAAKVVRKQSCQDDGTNYAMIGVIIRESPNADPNANVGDDLSSFCLVSEKGKRGIYASANCVSP